MSPIYDRTQAKEAGFAQVREAIQKVVGDVVSVEIGLWPPSRDTEGKPVPPKEYCEVKLSNVHVLEATEELSMDIEGKEFSFRIKNCSGSKGSFWIEDFLKSADDNEVLMPDGLTGKRVTFRKVTREAKTKTGAINPKFTVTNFIIDSVAEITKAGTPAPTSATPAPAPVPAADPMGIALELAVGKTEAQFRTAIGLDPRLSGNSILTLAKTGAVTTALVKEGKLKEVKQGNKVIYAKP